MQYMICIFDEFVKKLFICLSTHIFECNVTVKISKLPTSSKEVAEFSLAKQTTHKGRCPGNDRVLAED